MKKLFSLFALALVVQMANAQLIEPEYIGQAYALLPNGERIELQSEMGYVSAHSNTTTRTASSLNIWNVFLSNVYSVSQSYGKSEHYLHVPSVASLAKLRIKAPFSILLRLESNEYLPEAQIKIVRFLQDDGERSAHAGSGVSFHAVKVGKSSYQVTLDNPFYGEYGVVFKNDMNLVQTFSLGYSDEDVREYVKPFLEPGSVKLLRYQVDNSFGIFDSDMGEYIDESDFIKKYGADFYKRVVAEYKKQQKAIAKAQKALRKAQRKAKKSR